MFIIYTEQLKYNIFYNTRYDTAPITTWVLSVVREKSLLNVIGPAFLT